jgi:large subunit ribosomal protein L30e
MDINEELKKLLKDGEVLIGLNRVKKALMKGDIKMVLVASTAPREMIEDLKRYAQLSNVPYVDYSGTAKDLGYACAKPFSVNTLGVVKEGSSKILQATKE